MNNPIGTLFTLTGATVAIVFGLIYLFRPKFMGYHKMAVQKDWNELSHEMQTLILALMRTTGGGFLSVSIGVIILQLQFNKSQNHWIALAILIVGSILTLGTLYATILVRTNTKGRPPTFAALLLLILLLVGYFFNIM
jgi:uncharacterized protein YjeT (DUF2065 family)